MVKSHWIRKLIEINPANPTQAGKIEVINSHIHLVYDMRYWSVTHNLLGLIILPLLLKVPINEILTPVRLYEPILIDKILLVAYVTYWSVVADSTEFKIHIWQCWSVGYFCYSIKYRLSLHLKSVKLD